LFAGRTGMLQRAVHTRASSARMHTCILRAGIPGMYATRACAATNSAKCAHHFASAMRKHSAAAAACKDTRGHAQCVIAEFAEFAEQI
jgi:hypothetical protein